MCSLQNFVASISLVLIGTATTPSSAISLENYWLYNTPIQDVLNSGIGQKANEKILEKIINTVKQYASDCPTYKENMLFDLSAEGFKFPRNEIQIDLGSDDRAIILENIRISELPSNNRRSYSTSITCELPRTAKIEVKLPKDLEISARLKVCKITNSTSEFESALFDDSPKGSISLKLKDNSFSKQSFIQANYDEIIRWKIFHTKSMVSIDIAQEFQIPIHNKLQAIFDEVELPLKQFLIRKFDAEFSKSGISLANVCSKFVNKDKNLEEVNSRSQRDVYVQPIATLVTEIGRFESTGPILMDGLSSFNSTEFTISGNQALGSNDGGYYSFTTPSYDDPEIKEITIKIRTNEVKGRVDYSHNSELFPINFFVEFIEFEVKKKIVFQYESTKSEKEKSNKSATQRYPHGSYVRSNTNKVDIQVGIINLSKMKLKIPKISNYKTMDERESVTSAHSLTLFTELQISLTKTLNEKLNQSLFENCP